MGTATASTAVVAAEGKEGEGGRKEVEAEQVGGWRWIEKGGRGWSAKGERSEQRGRVVHGGEGYGRGLFGGDCFRWANSTDALLAATEV